MSRIKYFLALLIAMVFMVGCAQEKLEKKKPITIGVDVFPGWGHVFIAQEKGFFKKNGVDVEIVLTEKYLAVQDQFANNELDGAFMVYTDAIYAYSRGIDTRVVYISDYSISGDVIVAKPELKEVRDLEGKIIGIEGINSFSHMFVLSILEKHGLSEGDFFIKNVNAQDVVDELEQGDIDAGHVYGPGKFLAQQKGYSLLASAEEIEGIITDVLSFHNKIINERPGDIKAIIKSLFEAKKFQETNRKEAVAIIARAIQDTQDSVSVGIDAVKYI
ncbi:MAG: ABC transporter substrate-binding protein, partial [PVC group bacterium]|nr:ABC transporter substrate-binding protein [PVC group bacterium]